MVNGFWGGLNRHLIFWAAWTFTVGGAIASLWVAKEYAWIGALVALTGLIGLTVFAYQKHCDLVDAERGHKLDLDRLSNELRVAESRAAQAERKLAEVPADILIRLQGTIHAFAHRELSGLLVDYSGYVSRMQAFVRACPKPVTLKAFVKRDEGLYAVAGLSSVAIKCLQKDDAFRLEFKDVNALRTASARVLVHQLDADKEQVWFRVDKSLGDEMADLDALASKQDVPAKGYFVRPVCDLDRYANLDPAGVADLVRTMVEELFRERN
jgi:hypothetical protein